MILKFLLAIKKRILFVLVFCKIHIRKSQNCTPIVNTIEDIPCSNITGVINISSSVTSVVEF